MGSDQRNALLAVVLSGLILFGWQMYFAPKKDNAPIEPVTTQSAPTGAEVKPAGPTGPQGTAPAQPAPAVPAETFEISQGSVSATIDNSLAIRNFQNPQAAFNFKDVVDSAVPLKVELDFGNGFQTVRFARTDAPNRFYNQDFDATLTTTVEPNGQIGFVLNSSRDFKYRFTYKTESKKLENGQNRVFAYYTDELNLVEIGEEDAGDRAITWAGIDFNYHLFAHYFEKAPTLLYKSNPDGSFSLYSSKSEKSLGYHVVFVKKEYNYLQSLGHHLEGSVDFGIWGLFAVWILKGLQFFYKFFPNYGVSIILLTLVIRLITFPLQWKSFVSMKKLQVVQPELTKIREKFKDDPQRMQKESMELFKRTGANPIGGCLPLLLQMPVFFAFYKVLYGAVELVDAPFMLWIHDLSNKDPYYVLPVLMTIAMFLQQKLTPNTISDPVQKKVMLFMPLIFGFIMKDLPSGLSLYIFVSTLFGILQQLLVFSTKSDKPVVV